MMKKLLRKKLALLLADLKKKRPYYCEVEYLESSGTQCIDTLWSPLSNNLRVKFKVKSTSNPNKTAICGSEQVGVTPRWVFIMYGQNADTTKTFPLTGDWNNQSQGFTFTSGTILDIDWTTSSTSTTITDIKSNTTYTKTFSSTINYTNNTTTLKLFQNSNTQKSSIQMNYYKIWDNNNLVHDFIPVLDWDMTPCMYDKVTKQFFYNQGSGDFSYGREIHYVDYLEGTGTQYIDTKEKVDSTTKIILDFQMVDITSGTNGIFGASTSQTLQFLTQTTNNKFVFQWTPNSIRNVGTKNTNRNTVILDIPNKVLSIGIDSLSISSYTFSYPTGNIFLMANGHTSVYGRMKVFGCKIFSDSSVLKDFYPAIDENGVGYMFDRVSHTIFDNAGTGVFKYPARETEYTANAATYAYIDLGVKYKPSMTIEGKYTRNDYGTNDSVMMLTTTTTAPLIYLPALSGYTAERYVWRRPPYTEQSYFISTITYPFTCEMKVDAVNDTLTLNGNIVKTGMIAGMNGYDSPYESASNMYMFSIAGTYAGDGKIYYLKIIDGTTPLFDLIPAYKDGEAGFYNKVDGTFYKNAATQSSAKLTAGKILEPEYE